MQEIRIILCLTENSTLILGYIYSDCFIHTYTYKIACLINEATDFEYNDLNTFVTFSSDQE